MLDRSRMLVAAATGALLVACGSAGRAQQPTPGQPPESAARGNPVTLTRDARQFLTGDGAPRDREKALSLYLMACRQGERAGCTVIITAPGTSFSDQWAAIDVLVSRCLDQRDQRSCRAVEFLPLDSASGRDVTWFAKLCDRRFGQACTALEAWAGSSHATKGNPIDFLVRGCQAGDPSGCFRAAKSDSVHAQRFNEEGVSLLRRMCSAGVGLDCADLAMRYRSKFAGLDDDGTMHRLWSRAEEILIPDCVAGDLRACRLAMSSAQPSERILEASKMACGLDPGACNTLAKLYLDGQARDVRGAREAYEMSCMLEVPHHSWTHRRDDCVAGARIFEEDDPVWGADHARADVMLRRACELGRVDACTARKP